MLNGLPDFRESWTGVYHGLWTAVDYLLTTYIYKSKLMGWSGQEGIFRRIPQLFHVESVRELVISPPRAILESWQASFFGLAISRNSLTPTLVLCLPLSFLNTSWWNIFCSMEVYFKNNITYIHSSLETWLKHWEDVRLSCGLGGLRRIINILLWALTPQLRKGYRTVDQAIDEIYLKFKTIL